MKEYLGRIVHRLGHTEYLVFVRENGQEKPLRHIEIHSPDGFNWGFGGAGPSDLALSIMCDYFREQPSKGLLYVGEFEAQPHYQDFKWRFIAPLCDERNNALSTWVIREGEIYKWLKRIRAR